MAPGRNHSETTRQMLVVLIFTTSCLLFSSLLRSWTSGRLSRKAEYSYIAHDFPETLPMSGFMGKVDVVVEETLHYPLIGERAGEEWISTSPPGVGFVHLGPDHRVMAPSIVHEMHCLRSLRFALEFPTHHISRIPHLDHCLNYLRQMILCSSDLTLEPGDVLSSDFSTNREGMTHTCMDWTVLYNELDIHFTAWESHLQDVLDHQKGSMRM